MSKLTLPGEYPSLRWYRRWWFYLIVLMLGTVLGLIIRKGIREFQAQRDLDVLLADLDQSDPNWRLKDWYRALPVMPEGENLALLALTLQSGFVSEGPRYVKLFADRDQYPGNPLNTEQVQALRDMLAGFGNLRAGADRLLRLRGGRLPPPNFDSPDFRILTYFNIGLQRLRTTVNVFDYQADLWAQEGRGDDALMACRAMMRIAQTTDSEPFLVSHLWGEAMRGVSVTTLERVLARTEPGEDALAALQNEYWTHAARNTFSTTARGERACMDWMLSEIQQGRYSRDDLKKFLAVPELPSSGSGFDPAEILRRLRDAVVGAPFDFIPRERLEALRFYNEVLDVVQGEEGTILPRLKELSQKYQRMPAASMFAPAFVKVVGAGCKSRAMSRAAAILLAAERYRRVHGRLPGSWNELVPSYIPSVPMDPYDGQPLRWKNTGTGIMIYSVWMNRIDDGGRIRPNDEGGARDCGLELWDAKYRGKLPSIPLPKQGDE